MKIESNKVVVNAGAAEIVSFLTNAENIFYLLPQNQISDWKATPDQCSFKVQGGVTISLIENGTEENTKVFMKSGEKSPFPFNLTIFINENNGSSEGYILFDGEVNAFLKMMVQKPLTALFNLMSDKLKAHFEK